MEESSERSVVDNSAGKDSPASIAEQIFGRGGTSPYGNRFVTKTAPNYERWVSDVNHTVEYDAKTPDVDFGPLVWYLEVQFRRLVALSTTREVTPSLTRMPFCSLAPVAHEYRVTIEEDILGLQIPVHNLVGINETPTVLKSNKCAHVRCARSRLLRIFVEKFVLPCPLSLESLY
jgi:hypothetical protein